MAKVKAKKTAAKRTPKQAKPVAAAPVEAPSMRAMKFQISNEIRDFRDKLIATYNDFHGHDLRKEVAWLMEQSGLSVSHMLERERAAVRAKLIAENAGK